MELRYGLLCGSITLLLISVFYQELVSSSPLRAAYLEKNGRHPSHPVGVGSPGWDSCSNSEDPLNITAVTVTPMPPKRGQYITISANFTLGENVTDGTFDFELKYGVIVVWKNTTKLCDAVKFTHDSCPMTTGDHVLGLGFIVPVRSMKGRYNGTVKATDQDNKELFCLSINFQI